MAKKEVTSVHISRVALASGGVGVLLAGLGLGGYAGFEAKGNASDQLIQRTAAIVQPAPTTAPTTAPAASKG
jgi:hypothetical protein